MATPGPTTKRAAPAVATPIRGAAPSNSDAAASVRPVTTSPTPSMMSPPTASRSPQLPMRFLPSGWATSLRPGPDGPPGCVRLSNRRSPVVREVASSLALVPRTCQRTRAGRTDTMIGFLSWLEGPVVELVGGRKKQPPRSRDRDTNRSRRPSSVRSRYPDAVPSDRPRITFECGWPAASGSHSSRSTSTGAPFPHPKL